MEVSCVYKQKKEKNIRGGKVIVFNHQNLVSILVDIYIAQLEIVSFKY